jgi:diaminopimelate decarboxylase
MADFSKLIIKDFVVNKRVVALYYDLNNITERLQFLNKLQDDYTHFLFPVKAFPAWQVLQLAQSYCDGFDISNCVELNLVRPYLQGKKKTWCSAPYYVDDLYSSCDFVDINSNHALQLHEQNKSITLRLRTDELGYPSRFGFTFEESQKLLKGTQKITGLHFHLATQKNSLNDYQNMLAIFVQLTKLVSYPLSLNFGGGFAELSDDEIQKFIHQAKVELKGHQLYFEPGRWISKTAGHAVGRIIDLTPETVITSLSQECHLKWKDSHAKVSFIKTKESQIEVAMNNEFLLSGPTCYEMDILAKIHQEKISLGLKDLVVVNNISGYSSAWNHSFNGIDVADIVFIGGHA